MSDRDLIAAIEQAEDDAYYLGDGFVQISRDGREFTYQRIEPTRVMLVNDDKREHAKAAASHAERNG